MPDKEIPEFNGGVEDPTPADTAKIPHQTITGNSARFTMWGTIKSLLAALFAGKTYEKNLSNTTPAPPAGSTNIQWQADTSTPPNISGYVSGSAIAPTVPHNSLQGYEADRHVAHTGISANAGTGIQVSGDHVSGHSYSLNPAYIGQFDDDLPAAPSGAINSIWQETGAGPVTISSHVDFRGNPRLFSMFIPCSAMKPTVTSPPEKVDFEGGTEGVNAICYDFDAASTELLTFLFNVPTEFFNFSTYKFQPVWMNATTPGTGNVVWQSSAVAIANDEPFDAATGTIQTSTDAFIASGDKHVGPESAAITPAGGAIATADTIYFTFGRYGADAGDTYNQDARLIGVIVTFQ